METPEQDSYEERLAELRKRMPLIGAWGGILTNEEVDEFIEDIYAWREKATARPLPQAFWDWVNPGTDASP